jgi:hypothetical protein
MAKGFAKTGKAQPAQFGKTKAGASPKGFKQNTQKTATAAMQGKPMASGAVKAKPKNQGSKQFGKAPGKAVF